MQEAEVRITGSGSGRDGALWAIRRSGILNITMIQEKIRVSTRTLQWKCVESRTIVNVFIWVLYSISTDERGPRCVTVQDIILPPYVEIVDNTQHIAGLIEPIDLCIGLQLERNRRYRIKAANNFQDGSYPIYALFMPVRNMNHSIHSYGNEKQDMLFLEIWTIGSLTPKEALYKASRNLIDLFIPFLHAEEENLQLENNQHNVSLPLFIFHNRLTELSKKKIKKALKYIFIDQLELLPMIYNCLKKSNIHILLDLLNKSHEHLIKIEHFCIEDAKQILDTLEKHFAID
ncbi:hypothetical protein Cgig2_024988 [Carnegiea gigantea]|uniref:DNA-directed RNA polymerase n=1 Tax=Carnegiea gigantea TaxID=171969 RepID=A0A9Q1GPT1_9CARY|nr:hypothetical protein Cgig2_024988 [Carnegiea gigantea]